MSDGILDPDRLTHGQPALGGADDLDPGTPDLDLVADSVDEDRAVARGRSRGARETAQVWRARAEAALARAEAAQADAREAIDLAVAALAEADGLRRAMASRSDIDIAKGILVARLGIGVDDAFSMLVRSSQRKHVKVTEVARMVIDQPEGAPSEPGRGRRSTPGTL